LKATIDRIEGPMAVLVTQDDNPVTFNLPAAFIGEAREGDIVDITITRDPESTKAARERVSSLIEELKRKSG
jgi:histidinol dehydrogenase